MLIKTGTSCVSDDFFIITCIYVAAYLVDTVLRSKARPSAIKLLAILYLLFDLCESLLNESNRLMEHHNLNETQRACYVVMDEQRQIPPTQ